MSIVILVGVIALILFNMRLWKHILQPVNIFNIWWFFILLLSVLPISDKYVPSNFTYSIIGITIIFFNIGYYIIFYGKRKVMCGNNININDDQVNMKLIIILNFIFIICLIPYTIKAIKIINIYGFEHLRVLAFSTSTSFIDSTIIHSLFQYIINPFFLIVAIIGGIFTIVNKKIHILFKLSILNALIESLTFGGRTSIFRIIEIYILIFILLKATNVCTEVRFKKSLIIILIIPILYLTIQRGSEDLIALVNSFSVYYSGSLSLFSVYLSDYSTNFLNKIFLGRIFIGGLLNPFIAIISILGILDYKIYGTDYLMTTITAIPRHIGPTLKMNAAPTWAFYFLNDLGGLGIVLYPLIFGGVIAYIYKKMLKEINVYIMTLMVFTSYTMIKTTSGWMYLFISTWVAIFYIILFCKGEKKYERKNF